MLFLPSLDVWQKEFVFFNLRSWNLQTFAWQMLPFKLLPCFVCDKPPWCWSLFRQKRIKCLPRNDSCSQSTPSLSICSRNMLHFSYVFRSISNHSVSMTKTIMPDPLSRLACIFLIIAEKKGKISSPKSQRDLQYYNRQYAQVTVLTEGAGT